MIDILAAIISEVSSFQEARSIGNRIARYPDVISIYWRPIEEGPIKCQQEI